MAKTRDDFTKSTIDILAKRVGYLCSNPDCMKHTIGPNDVVDKATSIGIAAHITAASAGGPRYDLSMTEAERKHINNGIWLCSNCATLIDKDEMAFPLDKLKEWKDFSESKMKDAILGKAEKNVDAILKPFIEADLIWSHGGRLNRGYSAKNYEKFGGHIIPFGGKPIIYWDLDWNFSFVLHNNSRYPAYNIKLEQLGDNRFSYLPDLPKINNIPPYSNIDLNTKFVDFIEGTTEEADKLLNCGIPIQLNGLQIRMTYQDDDRKEHISILLINNGEISTVKE